MWLAFEACKCRESCTVYVCAGGKKRNIPLDIWLYIRVFLYYILYNFYKRVFEFMCMTKKGVMVFLFFFKKKQPFSAFTNIQLWCLIAWSKKTQLVIALYPETFCERYWYTLYSKQNKHLIALECFFCCFFFGHTLPNTALQKHRSHPLLSLLYEGRALM